MDTTELKQIVARHFDYAPSGQGQYLHGDWFTPKHKDSLQYTLEEVLENKPEDEDELDRLQKRVEELEEALDDIRSQADSVRA